jgi:hypothetical protein
MIIGDINGDGRIDSKDSDAILRKVAGHNDQNNMGQNINHSFNGTYGNLFGNIDKIANSGIMTNRGFNNK